MKPLAPEMLDAGATYALSDWDPKEEPSSSAAARIWAAMEGIRLKEATSLSERS